MTQQEKIEYRYFKKALALKQSYWSARQVKNPVASSIRLEYNRLIKDKPSLRAWFDEM